MRADTHDGPEQMLHVRGLIHCCSSHVRRSWNSVLQRTAGPYIMARSRRADQRRKRPVPEAERTESLRARIDEIDPDRTFGRSHYSITSSICASSDGEIVRPSACAVLILSTVWNFVGCSTGRSPGFAPLMILST